MHNAQPYIIDLLVVFNFSGFLFQLINTLWLEYTHIHTSLSIVCIYGVHIYIFFNLYFLFHFFRTSKAENIRKSLGRFRQSEL